VKLTDFGTALVLPHQASECEFDGAHPGSPAYLAPELLNRERRVFDPSKADIWSMGITLYAMVAGHTPWGEASLQDPVFRYIKTGIGGGAMGNFEFPQHFSEPLQDLLSGMLRLEPAERFCLQKICKHEWLVEQAKALSDAGPSPVLLKGGAPDQGRSAEIPV
jgi:carbon catabolite-derepressing protein kinase